MNDKIKAANLFIYDEQLICPDNEGLSLPEPRGNFDKRILILTDTIEAESEEHILLDKMIAATGLNLTDIYHLSLAQKMPLLNYVRKIKPERIICFGNQLDTESAIYSNRLYKIQEVNDIQILNANFLSQICASSPAKQALWNGLKSMFSL